MPGFRCERKGLRTLLFSLSSADFSNLTFYNEIPSEISSECQTVWHPEQAQHIVGPALGPNCFQKLSADDIAR